MKRIYRFISAIFLFMLFAGCVQQPVFVPVLEPTSSEGVVTVNISSGKLALKTAFPAVDYSSISYVVYGTNVAGERVECSTAADTVYQLLLAAGYWDITVEGKYNGNLFSKGTGSVTVEAGGRYSVSITTSILTTGTGNVRLKVAKFLWKGSDGEIRYKFENDAAETDLSSVSGQSYGLIEKTGLTTGSHEVTISYYTVAGGASYLLYRTREIINVFPNLTTNSWSSDSLYVAGNGENSVFTITGSLLEVLQSKTFYVSNGSGMLPDGDDNLNRDYTGSYTKPFESIGTALERIKAVFPDYSIQNQFTIYVDGQEEFSDKFTIESGMNVKIASYLSIRQATFYGGRANGAQILVREGAKLTLENVTIQYYGNGKGYDSNKDGAVLVQKDGDGSDVTKNGQLFIEGKCIIQNNYDGSSNDNVYLEDGCLIGINGLVTGSKVGVRTETAPTAAAPVYFTSGFNSAYYGHAAEATSGDIGSQIFSSDEGYIIGTKEKSSGSGIYEAVMGFSIGSVSAKLKDEVRIAISKNHHVVGYQDTTVSASAYVNGEKYTGSDCSWKVCLQAAGENVSAYSVATNSITIPTVFPEGEFGIYVEFTYGGNVYSDTVPFSCFKEEILELAAAPTSGTVKIKSQAGMDKIREWVNGGKTLEGVTIELNNDIELTDFTSIGNSSNPFRGVFDGKEHIITIKSLHSGSSALFGYTYQDNVVIKNIVLAGELNVTGNFYGILASSSYGGSSYIDNCVNKCNVVATGSVAGIFSNNGHAFTVKNCRNEGNLTSKNGNAGGIVSNPGTNLLTIDNCINTGTIIAEAETQWDGKAGGICSNNYCTVLNCINRGTVKGGTSAGGIVGSKYSIRFEAVNELNYGVYNCVNLGEIESTGNSGYAGGMIGIAGESGSSYDGIKLQNCFNYGNVSSKTAGHAGGLIGKLYDSSTNVDYVKRNFYQKDCAGTGVGAVGEDNGVTIDDKFYSVTNNIASKNFIVGLTSTNNLLSILNGWVSDNGSTTYKSWILSTTAPKVPVLNQ